MLNLNSKTVSYRNSTTVTTALLDINLKINVGEKIALIGPSGAGKTTLLNKLYEVALNSDISEPGFIHQDFALIEQLSVFHNVYIGKLDSYSLFKNLRNFLLPSKTMKKEIFPILKQLRLEEKMHTKAGELSGGQKQRLAIARSIFKQSDLILADEPIASLDPQQAEAVFNLLLNASPTVIVSLHITDMALRLCDRLIALRAGKIIFDGPPHQLTKSQLKELFK